MDITSDLPDPLRRIGFNALVARAHADVADHAGALARVIEISRSHGIVHTGAASHVAQPLPALIRESEFVVGDWVLVSFDENGQCWISKRLAPYSEIRRIATSNRRQTLVTNVDSALLVMGLDGDFNPRRLERYVALAKLGGVTPVVVLTKADLCDNAAERLEELATRLPAGIARYALNALDPAAVANLAPYLQSGQTAVLLGSSGTGKSTLTNTLLGSDVRSTAAVRDDGRGRHTTTSRQLNLLPHGGCLIDTPGLRGLRLEVDEASLGLLFEDITAVAPNCRFRDCRHDREPGCAVRAAITPDRLENFHKLRREVARDTAGPAARKAGKAVAKSSQRAVRALYKDRSRGPKT
jgi:ribosome biogenesis GTPase